MGAPGIVSVGPEIDLSEASSYFPECVLMGNLDPALIQSGTPQQVFERAVACIEQGRRHPGGFVLASGCEIVPESPPHNLETIIEAARHCGAQTTA
jgi:uroporphyrinogen decarboxylase